LEVLWIMPPKIDSTAFGSITVDGETFEHDILVRLSGEVKRRKKKLSKSVFGTSHIVSLAEAEHVHEEGCRRLIVGTGQSGGLRLSDEARRLFEEHGVACTLEPTPQAIETFNRCREPKVGLFHVTC
jgi:hypothetical protein